jgi:hypothetical protein
VPGKWAYLAQLFVHDPRHAADRGFTRVAGFPCAGNSVAKVESFDRVPKIAHEIAAPEFAIREDFKSQFLLLGENALDVTVFEGAQLFRIHGRVLARLEQFGWPQETSDVVGSAGCGHRCFLS